MQIILLIILCIFFFILIKLDIIDLLIFHNKNKKEWIKYLGNNNLLITNNNYHIGNKENKMLKKEHINEFPYWSSLFFGIISPSFYIQFNSSPNQVELFNKFNITRRDQFMDIGSGLGLMCFAMRKRYKFGKIIGIELNKKRYDNSIKNLEIMKMDRISLLNYSIFDYNIPKSITFAYAFNPFYSDNKTFEKFLNMLEGRKNLTLIWNNITLNYKNILKISKIAKAYETGLSDDIPYIIIYF